MSDPVVRASVVRGNSRYGEERSKASRPGKIVAEVVASSSASRFLRYRVQWVDEEGQKWQSSRAYLSEQAAHNDAAIVASGQPLPSRGPQYPQWVLDRWSEMEGWSKRPTDAAIISTKRVHPKWTSQEIADHLATSYHRVQSTLALARKDGALPPTPKRKK